MTELSEALSEQDKIMVTTKIVLNVMQKMSYRFHRPLKVITFNANGILRQCYELSKQLQNLQIDVALLSGHISNAMRDSLFQIKTFIVLTASQEEKAELPLE
jgi:hypothetical protein